MVTQEHLRALAPHDLAQKCLAALVFLSSITEKVAHEASDIEYHLEQRKGNRMFLGNLVRSALTWLRDHGFVKRVNQRETYMLTLDGEVAHTLLAYEYTE